MTKTSRKDQVPPTSNASVASKRKIVFGSSQRLKKPLNAYFLFTAKQRKQMNDSKTFKDSAYVNKTTCELAKMWGKRWKAMSDEEKAPYRSEALSKKAQYLELLSKQRELINA
mgnify:FL=1|jgi:hypothetical protein